MVHRHQREATECQQFQSVSEQLHAHRLVINDWVHFIAKRNNETKIHCLFSLHFWQLDFGRSERPQYIGSHFFARRITVLYLADQPKRLRLLQHRELFPKTIQWQASTHGLMASYRQSFRIFTKSLQRRKQTWITGPKWVIHRWCIRFPEIIWIQFKKIWSQMGVKRRSLLWAIWKLDNANSFPRVLYNSPASNNHKFKMLRITRQHRATLQRWLRKREPIRDGWRVEPNGRSLAHFFNLYRTHHLPCFLQCFWRCSGPAQYVLQK